MAHLSAIIRTAISLVMSLVMCVGSLLGLAWTGCETPLKDISQMRVSNGNRIIQERGFVFQAWTPAEGTGEPAPPPGSFGTLGFGPTFCNDFNNALFAAEPDLLWSLAKAPNNENAITSLPSGSEWLSADQLRYADGLISVCFGDEQAFSSKEAQMLGEWFQDFRTRHPDVLLHTNQFPGAWRKGQILEYLRVSRPDILTFDNYYFDMDNSTKDYAIPATIADAINEFRIPAMGGYDGSGEEPIPFGQYLLGYKTGNDPWAVGEYEITESQKNLVANLTATMGGKWLNIFRLVVNEDVFLLFHDDGTPTRHYEEYAEISRTLNTLGEHLVKLQTTDVQVIPGQHKWLSLTLDNALPKTVNQFKTDSALHLMNLKVQNLGSENNGLAGDVYLGSFATLPGAEFPGGKTRDYFTICNGLASGNGLAASEQKGSCDETKQEITFTLDGQQTKSLYYVDETTGQTVPADIKDGQVVFTLGGGKMRLFFWE